MNRYTYLVVQMQRTVFGCINCRQPTRTRMYIYRNGKDAWSHFCFKCLQTAVALADVAEWERVTTPQLRPMRMPRSVAAIFALAGSAMGSGMR